MTSCIQVFEVADKTHIRTDSRQCSWSQNQQTSHYLSFFRGKCFL